MKDFIILYHKETLEEWVAAERKNNKGEYFISPLYRQCVPYIVDEIFIKETFYTQHERRSIVIDNLL